MYLFYGSINFFGRDLVDGRGEHSWATMIEDQPIKIQILGGDFKPDEYRNMKYTLCTCFV